MQRIEAQNMATKSFILYEFFCSHLHVCVCGRLMRCRVSVHYDLKMKLGWAIFEKRTYKKRIWITNLLKYLKISLHVKNGNLYCSPYLYRWYYNRPYV